MPTTILSGRNKWLRAIYWMYWGYWLRYSLFFSISAKTCIKREKSDGDVNDVRFSNRPVGVKRFQTIRQNSVDVAREHTLLFGIGTRPLYGAFLVKKFNQGDSTLDAVG